MVVYTIPCVLLFGAITPGDNKMANQNKSSSAGNLNFHRACGRKLAVSVQSNFETIVSFFLVSYSNNSDHSHSARSHSR